MKSNRKYRVTKMFLKLDKTKLKVRNLTICTNLKRFVHMFDDWTNYGVAYNYNMKKIIRQTHAKLCLRYQPIKEKIMQKIKEKLDWKNVHTYNNAFKMFKRKHITFILCL